MPRTAEDIAQDVFVKAYQSFDMLRESPSAGGWLKTVSRNLTLNHLSRHRSRWRFFRDLAQDASEDGDGDLELTPARPRRPTTCSPASTTANGASWSSRR